MTDNPAIAQFWEDRRRENPDLPEQTPEAWAFGATPDHADSLLELVVNGTKTGTASSVWDYEHSGDPLPQEGDFSIILDGAGTPQALIQTVKIEIVPFNQVTAEHAHSEGEGDRSLADWRSIHERYWRNHSESDRGFAPDMPVLCERFRLIYPVPDSGPRGE